MRAFEARNDDFVAGDFRLHLSPRLSLLPPDACGGSHDAEPARAPARNTSVVGRIRGERAPAHDRRRSLAVQQAGTEVPLVGAGMASRDRRLAGLGSDFISNRNREEEPAALSRFAFRPDL